MQKNTDNFTIRAAQPEDTPVIFSLIRQLATYEKRPADVLANENSLSYWLFERRSAEVLLAEHDGLPVGYALFFPIFSSFAAKASIHLDDIFIQENLRGTGLGKKLMAQVAAVALERGYSGMEWSCLDWNEAAIEFYNYLGATQENGRVYMHLDEAGLRLLMEDRS